METDFLIVFTLVILISSFIHGSIGFGLGLISTPVVALFTDIQTTITYIIIPTMIVNLVSILSEGKFFEALRKFWLIILLMVIGSVIGTYILVYYNSEYFKLILAFIIFFYLFQSLVNLRASFIADYPKSSTYGLGLVGGVVSGLTNVVAPLTIMYTLELKYSKKDTIQLSNLCFLFTKVGQVATFVYFGEFSSQAVQISFASMFIVAIGLYFGIKIKKKIDAKFYAKILKVLLFIIAWVLVFQTVEF
ncbi:sulfite exporter TauE/SafE family protein [Halarcobacter bivalviorum]|uniref:Probable membrane transporter protein n=1 Tax=Halarcobacter bivalviorum TaxID=663364 RepID=A0AAX2AC67_9BACT|nr:sulfite exporter TauE/SafE family protein [Halarcobacter bivalviorum]AXH11776.1 sulfite exporter TauE/SafE family protein [Halarcobacter bivalviorum]RXK10903.1 hypothetical protein CRV05_00595 [Halarcobacter bivalviorum]